MRFQIGSIALLAAVALVGCDSSSSPLAPEADAAPSLSKEVDWQPIRDCGVDITQPGYYRLAADLIDCSDEAGSPLTISASNVVLDLNRYRIAMTTPYSPHLVGLHVGAVSDVQILGPGTIQGFTEFGIEAVRSTNLTIRRVTLRENAEAGINATGLTNALLHDNTFIDNRDVGATVTGSGLRLVFNRVGEPNRIVALDHRTTSGLVVGPHSSGIEVRGNVVTGVHFGLTLRNTDGAALVTGNDVSGNAFGLRIALGSVGNRIVNNRFLDNREIDMEDFNGCGPNFYRGNLSLVSAPSCLEPPRSTR